MKTCPVMASGGPARPGAQWGRFLGTQYSECPGAVGTNDHNLAAEGVVAQTIQIDSPWFRRPEVQRQGVGRAGLPP